MPMPCSIPWLMLATILHVRQQAAITNICSPSWHSAPDMLLHQQPCTVYDVESSRVKGKTAGFIRPCCRTQGPFCIALSGMHAERLSIVRKVLAALFVRIITFQVTLCKRQAWHRDMQQQAAKHCRSTFSQDHAFQFLCIEDDHMLLARNAMHSMDAFVGRWTSTSVYSVKLAKIVCSIYQHDSIQHIPTYYWCV